MYRLGAPPGWRRSLRPREIVANARFPWLNPYPTDQAAVDAVRAAWLPTLSGQAIPMVGEEVAGANCRSNPDTTSDD